MGHGRKKDQGSHHRRHKSSSSTTASSVATGKKPADDPFYELQVVDEDLVWITWNELLWVSIAAVFLIASYVYMYHSDWEASVAMWDLSTRSSSRASRRSSDGRKMYTTMSFDDASSAADLIEHNVKATIPQVSLETTARSDNLMQFVEEPRDGKSYGYDTYEELEEIVNEINSYSHDRFMEWDSYYESSAEVFDGYFENPNLYYDEEIVVRICPNSVLRRRRGPALYLNAESVLIECDGCIMEVRSGSHMIFGPYAQDVMIRGIHFKGATETSVCFPYDGAEVYFEDCYFSRNGSRGKHIGTVADINSTSSVDFLRCLMEKEAEVLVATSSLSIRTKDDEG